MKKYLFILLLALMGACEEDKKASNEVSEKEKVTNDTLAPGNIQKERDAVQTEKEEPVTMTTVNGRYRKMVKAKPAEDCNCNCIDISFDGPTEWCIVQDKVYINARSERTGENTADLYFVNVARDENAERTIPWEEFDTQTPIASIEFQPDGSAKLDWKGFSTGGKIATDYAIYGKKTLEGTYRKD